MRGSSEYEIPYTGLGLGRHAFDFRLDGAFFQKIEPSGPVEADITATTELDKFDQMMHFDVEVSGTVGTHCDRCNAPVTVEVNHRARYVIKFGSTTHKTDEDILVLGPAEHLIDVREFLYESTMLGLPLRRVHEDADDCDPQVLQWLTGSVETAPSDIEEEEEEEEETDPRWAALKGLSSDGDQEEKD